MSSKSYLHDFGSRMQNIGMFNPVFELRNLRKYDFPVESLGVAILLFVLERKLRGSRGVSLEEIADEFHEHVNCAFHQTYTKQEFLEFTTEFVHEHLMNKGELHTYRFWNFETNQFEEKRFALLTHTDIDVRERTSKLALTHEGLEILFKTKEMLNEIKVSIKTLYIRQQIERGVWDDALAGVQELRALVRDEADRITELAEKIRKDVLSVHRRNELQALLQRINEQIKRERREFTELRALVTQVKEEHDDEEDIVGIKMSRLERELYDVRVEHESLLDGKLNLQQLMSQNLDSLVLNMFSTKVNFETEVLLPLLKRPPTLETMNQILNPILPIAVKKSFHPAKVFEVQSLRTRHFQEEPEEVIELTEEQRRVAEQKEREAEDTVVDQLQRYLSMILLPLCEHGEVELVELVQDQELDDRFYNLLLELHQMGRIELLRSSELEGVALEPLPRALIRVVDEHDAIYDMRAFAVFAGTSIINPPGIRGVSNFIFRKEERTDEYI